MFFLGIVRTPVCSLLLSVSFTSEAFKTKVCLCNKVPRQSLSPLAGLHCPALERKVPAVARPPFSSVYLSGIQRRPNENSFLSVN